MEPFWKIQRRGGFPEKASQGVVSKGHIKLLLRSFRTTGAEGTNWKGPTPCGFLRFSLWLSANMTPTCQKCRKCEESVKICIWVWFVHSSLSLYCQTPHPLQMLCDQTGQRRCIWSWMFHWSVGCVCHAKWWCRQIAKEPKTESVAHALATVCRNTLWGAERHIKVSHKQLLSITSVTHPPGVVPGQQDLAGHLVGRPSPLTRGFAGPKKQLSLCAFLFPEFNSWWYMSCFLRGVGIYWS